MPAAISGAASGNDEEPACIRLKPFGKRQGLVEIEFRDDAGHVRGRAQGGVTLRRDRREDDGSLGGEGVPVLDDEGQGGASQRHYHLRRGPGVFVPQESGHPPRVPRIRDAREIQEISVDLNLPRGSFEQSFPGCIGDQAGRGKGVVEGVQQENTPGRLVRAGRCRHRHGKQKRNGRRARLGPKGRSKWKTATEQRHVSPDENTHSRA